MARGKESPYAYTGGLPSKDKKPLWVSIVVAVIGAIAVIIAALIKGCGPLSCNGPTPTFTPTPTPLSPVLRIRDIADGQSVPFRLDSVIGTYDRVPEDQQIWLIVMANNLCYPQEGPAERLPAGRWEHGPVDFPVEGEQQLRAALVTQEAAVELHSAVGKQEGILCDRSGVEVIDSVTVKVASVAVTPPPVSTPTPPASPTPSHISKGKVCEIKTGQDSNTVYLRQAEFSTLGLPAGSVINVAVLDTGGRVDYVTLDVDASLSTCVVRMSLSLCTALGVAEDTEIERPEDRPDRSLNIARSEIMVEITSLEDGQDVAEVVNSVHGTYKNIPADRELWIVVSIGANYFPQNGPAVLLPDGTWNHGSVTFGSIDEFIVYAVLVDEQGASLFSEIPRPVLPDLPKGALLLDSVKVHRSQ